MSNNSNLLILNNSGSGYNVATSGTGMIKNNESDLEQDFITVSGKLSKLALTLEQQYMSKDGRSVKYNEIKASELYKQYCSFVNTYLLDLDIVKVARVTKECSQERLWDLLAFWLNMYNCIVIHALIEYGQYNKNKLSDFFSRVGYRFKNNVSFTLDHIEHGLLRKNAIHPSSKLRYIPDKDARSVCILGFLDARIHFALNCGAKSCPAIRVYTCRNIRLALKLAAHNYCTNNITIKNHLNLSNDSPIISLPKLFLWYRKDFINNNENVGSGSGSQNEEVDLLIWIKSNIKKNQDCYDDSNLYTILDRIISERKRFVLEYKEYDWSINEA